MGTTNPTRKTVEEVVAEWPEETREAAMDLIGKYGPPDEATLLRLIWHDNGPWSRTELHREGPTHRFPVPHSDYLEQYIDYDIPADAVGDLARFDGSVHAHRTRGELGAVCHTEPANFLAVNLAHDVITGERSPARAREDYAAIMAKRKAGGDPAYMRGLQFAPPTGDTHDPDRTILGEELRQSARRLLGRRLGD